MTLRSGDSIQSESLPDLVDDLGIMLQEAHTALMEADEVEIADAIMDAGPREWKETFWDEAPYDLTGEIIFRVLDNRDAEYVYHGGHMNDPHVVIRLTPDPDQ